MTMKKGFASRAHGKEGLFEATAQVMGKAAQNIEATFTAFQALAKGDVPGFLKAAPPAIATMVKVGAKMLGIPFASAAEDRTPEEQMRLNRQKRMQSAHSRIGPPKLA